MKTISTFLSSLVFTVATTTSQVYGFVLSSSLPSGSVTVIRHERDRLWRFSMSNSNKNDDYDDGTWMDESSSEEGILDVQRRNLIYNVVGAGLLAASGVSATYLFQSSVYTPSGFTRIPTKFIAALGDSKANEGQNAKSWGLWAVDPGPRGVWLKDYSTTFGAESNNPTRRAPSGWIFDPNSWWLEEHGLIMESPTFPLPAGRYLVTGGRMVTTGLTISQDGMWKLDDGNSLYDVTHLPCRSAVYTPNDNDSGIGVVGSPLTANPRDFPVAPGAEMPKVTGCTKQDYAVLFVVGKATTST